MIRLSDSISHRILDALNEGPAKTKPLAIRINPGQSADDFYAKHLLPLYEDDLIDSQDFVLWELTQLGRQKLAAFGAAVKRPTVKSAIAAPRIVNYVGTYDGKDLQDRCARPGAYDFRAHPSLMGNKLIYR